MIEEFPFGAHTVRCSGRIDDDFATVWDARVAGGHPYKSTSFLRLLESCFSERKAAYLTVFKGGVTVGVSLLSFEHLDLSLGLRASMLRAVSFVRRIWKRALTVPTVMVGTYETARRHWWYDSSSIDADQFADMLLAAVERRFRSGWLLVIRDFVGSSDGELRMALLQRGFAAIDNHPMALVHLDGLTAAEHYERLRAKSRHTLRKLNEPPADQLQITVHDHFDGILDDCYALYLNVHNKAEDFKRPALPRAFFERVGKLPETRVSVLRVPSGKIVAFVMTGFSDSVSVPYILGMDYEQPKNLLLYHHILWHSIERSAERGCAEVDLGLTGYFVKQGLGASLHPMKMFGRIQKPWLNRLLGRQLPRTFNAPAPVERRLFREGR